MLIQQTGVTFFTNQTFLDDWLELDIEWTMLMHNSYQDKQLTCKMAKFIWLLMDLEMKSGSRSLL